MSWRIDRDESNYSSARKLAWEYVLPYKHIPILDSDEKAVDEMLRFLTKAFSPQALTAAVKRLNL